MTPYLLLVFVLVGSPEGAHRLCKITPNLETLVILRGEKKKEKKN